MNMDRLLNKRVVKQTVKDLKEALKDADDDADPHRHAEQLDRKRDRQRVDSDRHLLQRHRSKAGTEQAGKDELGHRRNDRLR